KIVEALQLELTPGDEQRIARRVHASGDALDLILKGRVALLRETIADVNISIEYFEQARDLEPKNPLPLLGLSDAYTRLAFTWDPEGGWWERAKGMCDRALELDPDIPEGRYMRGRLAWTPQAGFQHETAIRELVAALAERPNLNEGFDWLATILFHVGLIDESRAYYDHSLVINPDPMLARSHALTNAWVQRDYEATRREVYRLADPLETAWTAYVAVFASLRTRNVAEAEKYLEAASRKYPANLLLHSARAVLAALQKNEAATDRAIENAMTNRRSFGHFHHAELDIACALALFGRDDEAIERLTSTVH